jgi:hypothetical protein
MFAIALLTAVLQAASQQKSPDAIDVPDRNPLIVDADLHYGRRQEGRVGARANPREIAQAVAGYEKASQAPDSVEARWKLARALYFQATYTGQDADSQLAIYEKARRISQDAVRILERRGKSGETPATEGRSPADVAALVGSDRDAAPTFFWAAVAWGRWSLASGKLQAVRTGAAEKIRDYAETLIAMDPGFEEGGGYRLLGRLHSQAPKIPILTPWVSHEKAVENLRRALAVNGRNLVNRHFLAEALADGNPAERAEAITIEEAVVADAPSPGHLVEELAIQEEARANLAKWKK